MTKNKKVEIFVFGNPDFEEDSLPIRILGELRKKFPQINFRLLDPNEEWDLKDDIKIIDTVCNIGQVKIFKNLEAFQKNPNLTLHDFDALANLLWLKKIKKLKKITIIGLPPQLKEKEAVEKIEKILKELVN